MDSFNPDRFFVSERISEKNIFKHSDGSVPLEQNAGVILLPEKQERKEELPEMNEEESVSLKRRHPDSKSE